jgi:hypothetical protein
MMTLLIIVDMMMMIMVMITTKKELEYDSDRMLRFAFTTSTRVNL